jgi:hypothetical protein
MFGFFPLKMVGIGRVLSLAGSGGSLLGALVVGFESLAS